MTESELRQLDNLRPRLEIAVEALAVSGAHLRVRLVRAFESIFVFQSSQFPEGRLRSMFDEVVAEMTRFPTSGSFSSAEMTSRHLRTREAEKIAKEIFELYRIVTHELLVAGEIRSSS